MLKWAKVIDEETKQCEVGLGDDASYYLQHHMHKMDVEQACNGSWFLKGYAPSRKLPSWVENRINELKELLKEYDYIGVKIATGCATIDDYKNEIALCEEYRKEIRELQKIVQGDNNA